MCPASRSAWRGCSCSPAARGHKVNKGTYRASSIESTKPAFSPFTWSLSGLSVSSASLSGSWLNDGADANMRLIPVRAAPRDRVDVIVVDEDPVAGVATATGRCALYGRSGGAALADRSVCNIDNMPPLRNRLLLLLLLRLLRLLLILVLQADASMLHLTIISCCSNAGPILTVWFSPSSFIPTSA